MTPEQISMLTIAADLTSKWMGVAPNQALDYKAAVSAFHAFYAALRYADEDTASTAPEHPKATKTQIKASISDDYLICLEDGKPFKSLKRHLMTHYSMTPEQYRAKWGLPADYPMVAPGYSAKRSELAKASGLGTK